MRNICVPRRLRDAAMMRRVHGYTTPQQPRFNHAQSTDVSPTTQLISTWSFQTLGHLTRSKDHTGCRPTLAFAAAGTNCTTRTPSHFSLKFLL